MSLLKRWDQFRIEYDRNYGIDKRTGWSVSFNDSYVAQLEPSLMKALWKAWKWSRILNEDY